MKSGGSICVLRGRCRFGCDPRPEEGPATWGGREGGTSVVKGCEVPGANRLLLSWLITAPVDFEGCIDRSSSALDFRTWQESAGIDAGALEELELRPERVESEEVGLDGGRLDGFDCERCDCWPTMFRYFLIVGVRGAVKLFLASILVSDNNLKKSLTCLPCPVIVFYTHRIAYDRPS